jgi:hypothetical protein
MTRRVCVEEAIHPVDDLSPPTVITRVGRTRIGKLLVRGTTADNGPERGGTLG